MLRQFSLILLFLSFSGVSLAQSTPCIVVTPDPADPFPTTRLGYVSEPITFTVERTEDCLVCFTRVFIFSTEYFPLTNNTCETTRLRKKGDICTVDVSFAPDTLGTYAGTVAFTVVYGITPFQKIEVEGDSGLPEVTLSDTNLNFGDQVINSSSTAQDVTLSNTGNLPLTISDIAASGEFAQTNDCPATLDFGDSCTLSPTFEPTSLGDLTGELSITDDAEDSPQTVSLNGVGIAGPAPDLALSATQLTFPNQAINTTSSPMTVTATNIGTVNVTITDIDTTGDFAQTNDCPATLTPGDDCDIDTTFRPTAHGDAEGTLTITSNTSDSPQSVDLNGTGIVPGTPQASLSSDEVDFGDQSLDTDSSQIEITITNTGTSGLTMGESQLLGDDSHSFHMIDHCRNLVVPLEQTCTIDMIFSPVALGELSITLDVEDDADDSPQKVFVRGVGTQTGLPGSGCSLIR